MTATTTTRAPHRTFNGWPMLDTRPTTFFTAPNGKRCYVATTDVATLFADVARRWHQQIEPLPPATHDAAPTERHGLIVIHSWRPNDPGNTGGRSNHRSATAMDINGHLHHYEPFCAMPSGSPCGGPHPWRDGFTPAQRTRLHSVVGSIADDSGRAVLTSGLDFRAGKRDAMHVEVGTGVSAARLAEAAAKVRAGRSPTSFWFRATGEDVASWQELLSRLGYDLGPTGVDGRFGPLTERATQSFQRDHGLVDDGRVGPATQFVAVSRGL